MITQGWPHLSKRAANSVCERADSVVEDAQILAAIDPQRGRQRLQNRRHARQQIPARSLLQGCQSTAGCLLHVPVSVPHPRQEPLQGHQHWPV